MIALQVQTSLQAGWLKNFSIKKNKKFYFLSKSEHEMKDNNSSDRQDLVSETDVLQLCFGLPKAH